MSKISCCILTYNEADRTSIALTHALKWADEVCVIDKGSTDETRTIAEKAGAKVFVMNFTRQGHEDMGQYSSFASNDWIWGFTPGEVPKPNLIEEGRRLVDAGEHDLIRIPMLYYSFGIHHEKSPWSWSLQPRLYNRKAVRFTGNAHGPIEAERAFNLSPTAERYVLHQTHVGPEEFMRAHADYMINEANNGTPMEVMQRMQGLLNRFNPSFRDNPKLLPQALGWNIWCFGVMLHAWGRENPDIKQQYQERAETMLKELWP